VTQRNEQLAVQHTRAGGLDELALGIRVRRRHGTRPHVGRGGGTGLAFGLLVGLALAARLGPALTILVGHLLIGALALPFAGKARTMTAKLAVGPLVVMEVVPTRIVGFSTVRAESVNLAVADDLGRRREPGGSNSVSELF